MFYSGLGRSTTLDWSGPSKTIQRLRLSQNSTLFSSGFVVRGAPSILAARGSFLRIVATRDHREAHREKLLELFAFVKMQGSRREVFWSRREVLRTSLQIFIFFILTPNSSLLLPFHRYVTRQLLFIYVDLKFTITTLKPSKTLENALNPSQMRADSYVKYAFIKLPQTWTLLVLKQHKTRQ